MKTPWCVRSRPLSLMTARDSRNTSRTRSSLPRRFSSVQTRSPSSQTARTEAEKTESSRPAIEIHLCFSPEHSFDVFFFFFFHVEAPEYCHAAQGRPCQMVPGTRQRRSTVNMAAVHRGKKKGAPLPEWGVFLKPAHACSRT
ncbi:unnamed protein product [Ixodes pacificus]